MGSPIDTPLGVRASKELSSTSKGRERPITSTISFSSLEVCQDQGKVIGWKIVGLQDFLQLRIYSSLKGINLGTSKSKVTFSIAHSNLV